MTSGLTKKELAVLKILADPVKWIETNLRDPRPGHSDETIKLRDYQKEIIENKSIRKVVRAGRRLGKTAAMVSNMLYFAFTHPESVQIFATPYDSQAKLIYDELMKYINGSPVLKNSLVRSVKSPYEIEFYNKARIKGFTAGTRSGAEGGSLRGQAADYLYLDEVDYMSDADFETIYAIALEDPERIRVWCSSTPTGRRGMFWKICTGKVPGWKSFHYPIMRNPNWSPKMEKELKAQYSEQAYIHEFLAEFGEETVGVFKKEYIDRAKHTYDYGITHHDIDRGIKNKIFIGVDWDKYGAETTMVVGEVIRRKEKYMLQVIDKILIPKSEYTFDNAINKIVELNDQYNPEYIYVDRGSGEYQLEMLHKIGIQKPGTGLKDKVIGVSLGSSKTIIDPGTGAVTKKPLKSFMVNQVTMLFERDQIILNNDDEKLIRQIENYRVVKTSIKGEPIFSSDDEHGVDCIGFCVLAILDNFPELLKTVVKYNAVNEIRKMKLDKLNKLRQIKDEDEDERQEENVFANRSSEKHLIKVPVGCKDPKKYTQGKAIGSWGDRRISGVDMISRSGW